MGICGGVAQYFDVDPNLIRLIYAVITVITGVFPGLLAYVIGVLIVPIEPAVMREDIVITDDNEPTQI